jgi:YaiO family outer membrane protein
MRYLIILLLYYGSTAKLCAQPKSSYATQFQYARQQALTGHYEEANIALARMQKDFPNDYDALTLQARVYAWQQNYPASEKQLYALMKKYAHNTEILTMMVDVKLWSHQPDSAIVYIHQINSSPDNQYALQLKKGNALLQLQQYDAAYALSDSLLANTETVAARTLHNVALEARLKTSVALSFLYDTTPKRGLTRTMETLEIGQKVSFGKIVGRVNNVDFAKIRGQQYQAEAHFNAYKKWYGFIHSGFSPAYKIFPHYNIAGSLFRSLPHQIEVEVDLRYFRFEPSEHIKIAAIGLGKYIHNYWLNYKFTSINGTTTKGYTQSLTARRYAENGKSYVLAEVGIGSAGININSLPLFGNISNFSRRVQLAWSQHWSLRWVSTISAGAELIKYTDDNNLMHYNTAATIRYNF